MPLSVSGILCACKGVGRNGLRSVCIGLNSVPGLGNRGAGEQWTDERDETNHQKPRGGLPSTSGRKEVGKNRLADCKDIGLVSHGLSAER